VTRENWSDVISQCTDFCNSAEVWCQSLGETHSSVTSVTSTVAQARAFVTSFAPSPRLIWITEEAYKVELFLGGVGSVADRARAATDVAVEHVRNLLSAMNETYAHLETERRRRDEFEASYRRWAATDFVAGVSQVERALRDDGGRLSRLRGSEARCDDYEFRLATLYDRVEYEINSWVSVLGSFLSELQRASGSDPWVVSSEKKTLELGGSLAFSVDVQVDVTIDKLSDGGRNVTLCSELSGGVGPGVGVQGGVRWGDDSYHSGAYAGADASAGIHGCVTYHAQNDLEVKAITVSFLRQNNKQFDLLWQASLGNFVGAYWSDKTGLLETLGIDRNDVDFIDSYVAVASSTRVGISGELSAQAKVGNDLGAKLLGLNAQAAADIGLRGEQYLEYRRSGGVVVGRHISIEAGLEGKLRIRDWWKSAGIDHPDLLGTADLADALDRGFDGELSGAAGFDVKYIYDPGTKLAGIEVTTVTQLNENQTTTTRRISDPELLGKLEELGKTVEGDLMIAAVATQVDYDVDGVSVDRIRRKVSRSDYGLDANVAVGVKGGSGKAAVGMEERREY
jgi:hypothetical protein